MTRREGPVRCSPYYPLHHLIRGAAPAAAGAGKVVGPPFSPPHHGLGRSRRPPALEMAVRTRRGAHPGPGGKWLPGCQRRVTRPAVVQSADQSLAPLVARPGRSLPAGRRPGRSPPRARGPAGRTSPAARGAAGLSEGHQAWRWAVLLGAASLLLLREGRCAAPPWRRGAQAPALLPPRADDRHGKPVEADRIILDRPAGRTSLAEDDGPPRQARAGGLRRCSPPADQPLQWPPGL
jgi:hypothetical protein